MCYGAAQRYPINVRATGLQQSHLLRTRPLRQHYPRSHPHSQDETLHLQHRRFYGILFLPPILE